MTWREYHQCSKRGGLGQDLAGNECIAFSMIGDLERVARASGDRGYRCVPLASAHSTLTRCIVISAFRRSAGRWCTTLRLGPVPDPRVRGWKDNMKGCYAEI
jgi:hypothetical protein